ncbi:MAG: SPASM domain-containing protein [Candidatus Parcubacteria bacterium]|nr:SPASM domain-containing protein [Candidatus Parcubacteria bacterium]
MKSIAFDYDLVSLVNIPVVIRVNKLMSLIKYANEKGIDFFGTWDSAFRNLTNGSLPDGNHAFCAAVEGKSLEFNVDGSIKICSHTTTKVGHVDAFDLLFQETGGLFLTVKERFPGTEDFCSGCAIEGQCGGQCHVTREVVAHSAVEEGKNLFTDMCDFYRMITSALAIEGIRSNRISAVDKRQCRII